MVKPFGVDELRARLRALQRRSSVAAERSFHTGDLDIDVAERVLRVSGEERRLTPTQWRIVAALVEHPGQLLTYKRLAQRVYGDRSGDEARETLRAHIRTVRKTFGDSAGAQRYVRTEAGVGYRWVAADDVAPELPPDDDTVHELNNVLTAMRFGTHLLHRRLGRLVETGAEVGPLAEVTDRLESLVARASSLTVELQQKEDPTRAGGRRRGRP